MRIIHRNIIQKKPEWQTFLHCSDLHLGEDACDKKAMIADFEEAKERNARINIYGDLFGMILPKDLKRYQPSTTEKKLQHVNALVNKTVEDVAELLLPYANLIDVIGIGNHELSVINYHSVDPNGLLLWRLQQRCREEGIEFNASHGGISGYICYKFDVGGHRKHYIVKYHHGAGGSAPVTKGMIGMSRIKVQWIADLYVEGHDHNRLADTDVVASLNSRGNLDLRETRSIKCGNYRRSYPMQTEETAANVDYSEASKAALKPIGGMFVKVKILRDGKNSQSRILQVAEV